MVQKYALFQVLNSSFSKLQNWIILNGPQKLYHTWNKITRIILLSETFQFFSLQTFECDWSLRQTFSHIFQTCLKWNLHFTKWNLAYIWTDRTRVFQEYTWDLNFTSHWNFIKFRCITNYKFMSSILYEYCKLFFR